MLSNHSEHVVWVFFSFHIYACQNCKSPWLFMQNYFLFHYSIEVIQLHWDEIHHYSHGLENVDVFLCCFYFKYSVTWRTHFGRIVNLFVLLLCELLSRIKYFSVTFFWSLHHICCIIFWLNLWFCSAAQLLSYPGNNKIPLNYHIVEVWNL